MLGIRAGGLPQRLWSLWLLDKHLDRAIKNTCLQAKRYTARAASAKQEIDISEYPPERIRNFSIIAHIDHGKSTLADRLLEQTGVISKTGKNKQVLDKLKVERERGITVKAQSASMFYEYKGKKYLMNLIDTPGHVDFNYEVSRSLAACQGTILLVDAAQGIQAQTVANFYLAFGEGLQVIPMLNKVDLPTAEPERAAQQIESTFEIDSSKILHISAKSGMGVDQVLPAVIENTLPPEGSIDQPFRALLFDTWYDKYVGVVCLMAIKEGVIKRGDRIVSSHSKTKYEVTEVGIMYPDPKPTTSLQVGQVGYIICNMKSVSEAHVGDTFYKDKHPVEPLPGFVPAKSMVFAGVFPLDADEFSKLDESIQKLTLNDSSVSVHKETSAALGQGWRLGFLGTLHMDVFRQRLEEEYNANILITAPTVPYKIKYRDGTVKFIKTPADFPDGTTMQEYVESTMEPFVLATMIFPKEYLGQMLELCTTHRGEIQNHTFIDESRVMLTCRLPMSDIVTDFFDKLKSKSQGFASFDYEDAGYDDSQLVKMEVLLNGEPVDALAAVMHKSNVVMVGRDIAKRLKEVIRRQLFDIIIQTAANGKIVARETVKQLRKNVTAKCYGGDITRKMKLLNKQKEGKKRMKKFGKVELPQEAFLGILSKKD
ncbi:Translation factor guf1 mitochondrial [Coemansia sp. RSA 989]|nr:Translation factor guf1 mitochondrial [Coemansia sp. RSA 1086]KAJ1753332.1 Translation factor guf1 mitochondrial [Coemansia sp. RSA 1821]KAJ1867694.1 Translation factor guf1 mitochondrial [Coemansia sp. RSA 989]KAJ1875708.1 Translation factor guf1 mitochondrial [Coemansia sp. RSA 990]KAJ2650685.1 Translation factor guf1 mitochondrial [Coemansia sp. RSA 1250]KAJ2673856.1 Translation factor guf1 mitochondrial [Coemansia sp. RSA 1085]